MDNDEIHTNIDVEGNHLSSGVTPPYRVNKLDPLDPDNTTHGYYTEKYTTPGDTGEPINE